MGSGGFNVVGLSRKFSALPARAKEEPAKFMRQAHAVRRRTQMRNKKFALDAQSFDFDNLEAAPSLRSLAIAQRERIRSRAQLPRPI